MTKIEPSLWTLELCKIYKFFEFFSIMCNAYANVSIAIERFRCVVFRTKHNYFTILINILAFYIFSFSVTFINLNEHQLTYENHSITANNPSGVRCEYNDETEFDQKLLYAIILIISIIVLPITLIITFYSILLHKLRKTMGMTGKFTNKRKKEVSKFKIFFKGFWQLLLIFCLCQMPYVILTLVDRFEHLDQEEVPFFILDLTLILTASHGFFILVPYRYLIPYFNNRRKKFVIENKTNTANKAL